MAPVGTIRRGWQGGEDDFALSPIGHILSLEEKCGAGISAIYRRLLSDDWGVHDVREPIRLGLIGGGMKADKASKVVEVNVDQNPNGLGPSVLLAIAIIQAAIFGVPKDDDLEKKAEVEGDQPGVASSTTMAASAGQQSTDLAAQ